MSSIASALAGAATPRPMTRLKYRRPVAAQLITRAPSTVRVAMPASSAHSGGAAAYESAQALATAASIALAVARSTGVVSMTSAPTPTAASYSGQRVWDGLSGN